MSESGAEDTERNLEPTEQKLQKAREKGEFARSSDLSVMASYAGLLLASVVLGASVVDQFGLTMAILLEQSDTLSTLMFGEPASPVMGGILWSSARALGPWFAVPFAFVLLSILAQRAFVATPSKLAPKLNRISILANAKNKFGRNGLFEFAKSFVKLLLYSLCLGIFFRAKLDILVSSSNTGPRQIVATLADLCLAFLLITLLISGAIGVVDTIWQHFEHRRKNRMSHKELTDETKEAEGDPHMKQHRRARAYSVASNQMMADVPSADVIMVNPTHYSVALRWDRKPGTAPVCVAKGVDEIAFRIREIAGSSGVPIHRDPPAARAIFETTEIGSEISEDLYGPVASAIRFADEIRKKAREQKW